MNKLNIKDFIKSINERMNDISIDFVVDYTQEIRYLSDCFIEFADSCCPVYYNQVNEECTDEMIDNYLFEIGTFEVKDSSDIDKLKICALANDYSRQLYEDEQDIKRCIYATLILEDDELLSAVKSMNEDEFKAAIECMVDDSSNCIDKDYIYKYIEV